MIYIHVPFCKTFCTYCDFYSELCSGKESRQVQSVYADKLCEEIKRRREEIEATRRVGTIYVGGGTPSCLDVNILRQIVNELDAKNPTEFTVEVNPEDIVGKGVAYAQELKSLGVNRISMGVQSFDDGLLRWMNRRHDARRAVEAFGILREAGFDNISIDLIFGVSLMDDSMWMQTLRKAIELKPEHISAYQLSIEDGSVLASMVRRGLYNQASEELCRKQYDMLTAMMAEAGYEHYEVSNFALPGKEAVHNSAYWERVPYVGLGPGAHSFDGKRRCWNSEGISDYVTEYEELSDRDEFVERVMLALRTARGIEASYLYEHCEAEIIEKLLEHKALEQFSDRLRIPEDHFFVSDEIIGELI